MIYYLHLSKIKKKQGGNEELTVGTRIFRYYQLTTYEKKNLFAIVFIESWIIPNSFQVECAIKK